MRDLLQAMEDVPALPLPRDTERVLQVPGPVVGMFACSIAALRTDRLVLLEGQPLLRWMFSHDGGHRVYLHLLLHVGASKHPPDPTP